MVQSNVIPLIYQVLNGPMMSHIIWVNLEALVMLVTDVGDGLLVTLSWRQILDFGDRIVMLATFFIMLVIFQCIKSVTDIPRLSPTDFVSKIRHQHPSPTTVTNLNREKGSLTHSVLE